MRVNTNYSPLPPQPIAPQGAPNTTTPEKPSATIQGGTTPPSPPPHRPPPLIAENIPKHPNNTDQATKDVSSGKRPTSTCSAENGKQAIKEIAMLVGSASNIQQTGEHLTTTKPNKTDSSQNNGTPTPTNVNMGHLLNRDQLNTQAAAGA